jgi:ABC-type nitrate/sulfonate/bicarbonate transport system substrate-binding protein
VFQKFGARAGHLKEVNYLLEGRVDAIYSVGSAAERLILDGGGRFLYDFQADPGADQVNIEYPSTVTVSGQLARENPEAVVLYLRLLIKTARWGHENLDEVIRIFAKGAWLDDEEAERRARTVSAPLNLVPELSNAAVAALEREKNFLLANGFIKQDFAVEEWIDPTFLAAALDEEERR